MECSVPDPTVTHYGPVDEHWSTSFENGLCDHQRAGGRCYGDEVYTSREVVTWPAHSGRRAAAFTIKTDSADEEARERSHTRCFLEGRMPEDAVYGAWFYLPQAATDLVNWNLVHVLGGEQPTGAHGMWDISLENTEDGGLSLYVADYVLGGPPKRASVPVPVPIGTWFHLEFRWRRADDETGIVALYQDGQLLWEETDRVTDASPFAQWYVGNLAISLTPATSTIYVDDVTIRPAP